MTATHLREEETDKRPVYKQKMNERDTDAVEAIQEVLSVETTPVKAGIALKFSGTSDNFTLSTKNDEFTIFADEWHEHFPNLEQLKSFLTDLFSGTAKIVIKYLGKTPVAHQRQILKENNWIVMSRNGSLVSPFWKPKSYKTIGYENCQQDDGEVREKASEIE